LFGGLESTTGLLEWIMHWTTRMGHWTPELDHWTTGMDHWTTGMDNWIHTDCLKMPLLEAKPIYSLS